MAYSTHGFRGAEPNTKTTINVGTLFRSALFCAVFVLVIISLHPIEALPGPEELAPWEAGDVVNQVAFSLCALVLVAVVAARDFGRLLSLFSGTLIATLIWFAISVIFSQNFDLSMRRYIFTIIVVIISATWIWMPVGFRHFSMLMAVLVTATIVGCYAVVAFLPDYAVHQPGEFQLSGDWRGLFSHKNEAGAMMVILLFVGLFIARAVNVVAGAVIAISALGFLLGSAAKTSMILLPGILLLSYACVRANGLALRLAICIAPLVGFIAVAFLATYTQDIANLLDYLFRDVTFTGRTDVWKFAVDRVLERPITGYGFSAFWRTRDVFLSDSNATWANTAAHSHNSYLDLALTTGLPGLACAFLFLVVTPLLDFHHRKLSWRNDLMSLLFLRIWLFGIYFSCFESVLFDRSNRIWFLTATSIFGLHLLRRYQVAK